MDLLANDKIIVVLISSITTVIVFFLTLFSKRWIESRIYSSRLKLEHKFAEQKKIKEAIAKYKIQLITACDDLNHRFWNFSKVYDKNWLNVKGKYNDSHYHYFHSFTYRFLAVFAWLHKINSEIIYLDTTIASKEDLEFIKFTNVFSRIFCDLTFIEGDKTDGSTAVDHFFKNQFAQFPLCLLEKDKVLNFSEYENNINSDKAKDIVHLYQYLDNLHPDEKRRRWDRMHLFHLSLILFLNNYGYDFQKTNEDKIKQVLTFPKISMYLGNFEKLLDEYCLSDNREVKSLFKTILKVKSCSPTSSHPYTPAD